MFHVINSLLTGKVNVDTALAEIEDQIDWSDVSETLRRTLCLPAKEVGLNDWEKLSRVFVAAVPQESHQCFTEFLITHAYNKHVWVRVAIASIIVALVDKFPPHEIRCSMETMTEFLNAIMALMQDRSPDIRLRGLKVCKHWNLPRLHQWVRILTSDLVLTVRANAVRGLRWPEDQDIIYKRLRDKCVTVRRAAMSRIETVPNDVAKRDLALAAADDPRLDDACRNMLRGWVEREHDGLWKIVKHPSTLLLRHLGSVDSVAVKLAMASPTDGTPIGKAFLIRALAYCGKEPNIAATHILSFLPPTALQAHALAPHNNEDTSVGIHRDTARDERPGKRRGDTACGDGARDTRGAHGGAPRVEECAIARRNAIVELHSPSSLHLMELKKSELVVHDGEQLIATNIHEDEKWRIGPQVVKDLLFAAVRNNAHQKGMEEVALHVIEHVGLDAAVQDVWAGEPTVFVAAVQLLRRRHKLPVSLPSGPRFPQCVPPTEANALEMSFVHTVMRRLTSPTRRLLALHAVLSETRTPLRDAESLHRTLTDLISHTDDTVHSLAVLTSGLVYVLAPTSLHPTFFDAALRREHGECSGRPAAVEQRDVDIALQVLAEATRDRQQVSLERWWDIVCGGSDNGRAGSKRSLDALNRLLFLCLRVKVPNIFYAKMLTTAFQTVPSTQECTDVLHMKNRKKRKMEHEGECLCGTPEFRFILMRFFGMLVQVPSRCTVPLTSLEYCRPSLPILAFVHRLYASPLCLHSKMDSAVTLTYVCGRFTMAECAKALDVIVGRTDAHELFAWVPPAERTTVFQRVAHMKHVRPRLAANAAAREASGVEADSVAAVQNSRPKRKKHTSQRVKACGGAFVAVRDGRGTIHTGAERRSMKKCKVAKVLEPVDERLEPRVVDVEQDRAQADEGSSLRGGAMAPQRESQGMRLADAWTKSIFMSDSRPQVSAARVTRDDENSPSNICRHTATKGKNVDAGHDKYSGSPYNGATDMGIDEEFPLPQGQQMRGTYSGDCDEPTEVMTRALVHVTPRHTLCDTDTMSVENTPAWYLGGTTANSDDTDLARASSLLERAEDSRAVDRRSTGIEPLRSTTHCAALSGQTDTMSQGPVYGPQTRKKRKIEQDSSAITQHTHEGLTAVNSQRLFTALPRVHTRSGPAFSMQKEECAAASSRMVAQREGGIESTLRKDRTELGFGTSESALNVQSLASSLVIDDTPPVPKREQTNVSAHDNGARSRPSRASGRYAAFNIDWDGTVYSVAATAVLRVGRNRGCDICFVNNRRVSSTHLWLRAVDNGAKMEVEDTSAIGTIIQPLAGKSYKIQHAKTTLYPSHTTRLILSGTSATSAVIMVRARVRGSSSLVHCGSGVVHRLATRGAASTVGRSASSTVCIVDDRVLGTHLQICDYLLKSFASGVRLHREDEAMSVQKDAEVDMQQNDVVELAPDLRFQFKVDEQ